MRGLSAALLPPRGGGAPPPPPALPPGGSAPPPRGVASTHGLLHALVVHGGFVGMVLRSPLHHVAVEQVQAELAELVALGAGGGLDAVERVVHRVVHVEVVRAVLRQLHCWPAEAAHQHLGLRRRDQLRIGGLLAGQEARGRDALVDLADGRSMLRRLMPSVEPTRFDLVAYNAPLLPSVAVRSARSIAGVLWPEAWRETPSVESPKRSALLVDEKF